jgi:signal transduction histidine kinase
MVSPHTRTVITLTKNGGRGGTECAANTRYWRELARIALSARIALVLAVRMQHNPILIVIACAIAVLATFVALDVSGRVRRSRGRSRALWCLGGATGMAVGIWSMHFVTMLALELPAPIQFDAPLVLLTVLVAIAASALALHVRSRPVLPVYVLVMASLLMGAAISGLQYTDVSAATLEPALTIQAPDPGMAWHMDRLSIAAVPGTLLILGLALTIGAIDEREKLFAREQRMRHEIEAASHLKDEFLATLSHELRTPLNVILGRTQMLRSGVHDEEKVRQLTDMIERNGSALAKLVEDLLDVSRITLGHVRLETQPIRLVDLLNNAAQSIQPAAQGKNIQLSVEGTDPGKVIGDSTRLQQIIWNLLTNAIKFTPPHGQVMAGLSRHEGHVVLTVSDSGCGIDPAFLPHIFEPFRQGEPTASRIHGGLGIGLSIARHLVELHGGTIAARSGGAGQGSTFVVTLPAHVDGHVALRAAEAAAPPQARSVGARRWAGPPKEVASRRVPM